MLCTYKSCNRTHAAKGFCIVHYSRNKVGGDMDAPMKTRKPPTGGTCTIGNCKKKYLANGMCPMHYSRARDGYDMFKQPRVIGATDNCTVCGKEYRLKYSLKGKRKACSRFCASLLISGDKCHTWKGGITKENIALRQKFYKTTRKTVIERDEYTCQFCKKVGGLLHIDHLKSWSENPELRFDPDNCRTLCVGCHYSVTFGKKMPEECNWVRNRTLILNKD